MEVGKNKGKEGRKEGKKKEKNKDIKQKFFWKMQFLTEFIVAVNEESKKKNHPNLSSIILKNTQCLLKTKLGEISLIRTFFKLIKMAPERRENIF